MRTWPAFVALRDHLQRLEELNVLSPETRRTVFNQLLASSEGETLADDASPAAARASARADSSLPVPEAAEAPGSESESLESLYPAPALPVAERTAAYAAARLAAATTGETTLEEGATREPMAPRAALSQLVGAFLEQKHIRWGELVGGLLIVFCSIALVISFWSQIAERPILKFFVFNGVSAAMFGAGLYAERKWRIPTTSRGILMIAMLLTPLNFLAIAALTQRAPPTDFASLAGEGFSLVAFGCFVYIGSAGLLPHARLSAAIGVLVPSLLQLLIRRFVAPGASWLVAASFAAATLAVHAGVVVPLLLRQRRSAKVHGSDAIELLTLLGVSAYASVVPLALLVYRLGGMPKKRGVSLRCSAGSERLPSPSASCWRGGLRRRTSPTCALWVSAWDLPGQALRWPLRCLPGRRRRCLFPRGAAWRRSCSVSLGLAGFRSSTPRRASVRRLRWSSPPSRCEAQSFGTPQRAPNYSKHAHRPRRAIFCRRLRSCGRPLAKLCGAEARRTTGCGISRPALPLQLRAWR